MTKRLRLILACCSVAGLALVANASQLEGSMGVCQACTSGCSSNELAAACWDECGSAPISGCYIESVCDSWTGVECELN